MIGAAAPGRGCRARRTLLCAVAGLLLIAFARPLRADTAPPVGGVTSSGVKGVGGGTDPSQSDLFTGSFQTAIPIEVPPGIGGLQPALALRYDSSSPLTWVGAGWDLSLGWIQRSTKNGISSATANDFVLMTNGAATDLVPVGDGTYRAKLEGAFQKFVPTRAADGTVDHWDVWDKAGTHSVFGTNASAKWSDPSGHAVLWSLQSVTDRNGNYLSVSYDRPASDERNYPAQVSYGGNSRANRSADRTVSFDREPSVQPTISYAFGFPIWTRSRLKTVRAAVRSSAASQYNLTYGVSADTGRETLTGVRRTGTDGATAFPTTSLTYSRSADPLRFSSLSPTSDLWYDNNDVRTIAIGDFDGDGKQDYAHFPGRNVNPKGSVFLSTGRGMRRVGDMPFQAPSTGIAFGSYILESADFNGDGRADLLTGYTGSFDQGGTDLRVYLSTGGGGFGPGIALPSRTDVVGSIATGDFNGDGFADLIVNADVYLSNGDGTFRWASTLTDMGGHRLIPGDFNGDGRTDLFMYGTGQYATRGLWISNGDGTFTAVSQPTTIDWSGPNTQATVADVNGDGLSDLLVWVEGTDQLQVLLNNGKLGFQPAIDTTIGYCGALSGLRPGDFNGDGRIDLIAYREGTETYFSHVLLGNGDGTFTVSGSQPGNNFYGNLNDTVVADFDGDGASDLLTYRLKDWAWFDYADGPVPDLLTSIGNGLGGTTSITYQPSSAFSNRSLPFVKPLVTDVSVSDGLCATCPHTSYSYEGGYFDLAAREFLGFRRVQATDADGNKSITLFHQDTDAAGNRVPLNALKGHPYHEETVDAMLGMLASTDLTWSYISPSSGSVFARIATQRDNRFDGGVTTTEQTDFVYDDAPAGPGRGNLVKTIHRGDPSDASDDWEEAIEYASNDSASLYGFPNRVCVERVGSTALGCSTTAGDILSIVETDYDGTPGAPLPFGQIANGNPTRVRRWLDTPNGHWVSASSEYDAYGHPTAVVDPLGNRTETTYDADGFPITVQNALHQSVHSTFDVRTGNVLTNTDLNGQTSQFVYDALGRRTQSIGPLDSTPVETVDYHDGLLGQPGVQYVEKHEREPNDTADQTNETKTFLDGLGRPMRVEREAAGGRTVITETQFNDRGLPYKTSVPRFDNAATTNWIQSTYDALGRTIDVRRPDGTESRTAFRGRTVDQTDANGKHQQADHDAFGRLVRRWEPSISAPTVYQYDLLGRLVQLTDALGHSTTFGYDSLGRRLQIVDPNAGTWTSAYDDMGNVVSQTDPRGVKLTMRYDALNRLLDRTFAVGSSSVTGQSVGTVLAAYRYDDYGDAALDGTWLYEKGRTTSVTDTAGSSQFFHDRVGRPVRDTRTESGTTYTTDRQFDAVDRVTQIQEPDGTITKPVYDTDGTVSKMTDSSGGTAYAALTSYDAEGRLRAMDQGNGALHTTIDYDSSTDFLSAQKIDATAGAAPGTLQSFAYTTDAVGNIRAITDRLSATRNESFGYDDLYRLSSAAGAYGSSAMQYDAVGNIQSKGDIQYAYGDASHPSRLTATSLARTPAKDGSTILSFGFEPTEPLYTLSGTVRNAAGIAQPNVAVVLSGPVDEAVLTSTAAASLGQFSFRGVAGGGDAVYSLWVASGNQVSAPLSYSLEPLTQSQAGLDFVLSTCAAPSPIGLRVPRTTVATGAPQSNAGGSYAGGSIDAAAFGDWDSTGSVYAGESGYSPLPDAADAQSQTAATLVCPATSTLHCVRGPSFAPGRSGQSLVFSGADTFIFPASTGLNAAQLTLMIWAKPTAFPSTGLGTLLSKSASGAIGTPPDGYRLSVDPSGKVVFEVGRAGGAFVLKSTGAIPTNKWTFISATVDGAAAALYVNGVASAMASLSATVIGNDRPIVSGGLVGGNNRPVDQTFFSGALDEPRVANRAWSPGEVSAAYADFAANATFTYDEAGNQIAKTIAETTWTYRYDADGRLNRIAENGATLATYAYDAGGERTSKTVGTQTTRYIGRAFEIRPDGTQITHLSAAGRPVADVLRAPAGTTSTNYIVTDHLGSARLITDASGNVLQRLDYEPWGRVYASSGTSADLRTYTGQDSDVESGLMYYGARYYDSGMARFLSPDAVIGDVANPQDLDAYAYVNNSPTSLIDPTGNSWSSIMKGITSVFPGFAPSFTYNAWTNKINSSQDAQRYGSQAVAWNAAIAAAGVGIAEAPGFTASEIDEVMLNTGEGKRLQRSIAREVFQEGLGMSPRTSTFLSALTLRIAASSAMNAALKSYNAVAAERSMVLAEAPEESAVDVTIVYYPRQALIGPGDWAFLSTDWVVGAANFSAGWGDTMSMGATSHIRGWMGIQSVDPESISYGAGELAGMANQAGLAADGLIEGIRPGGWMNSNRYLRIGWGRHGVRKVLRISGKLIGLIKENPHINLYYP